MILKTLRIRGLFPKTNTVGTKSTTLCFSNHSTSHCYDFTRHSPLYRPLGLIIYAAILWALWPYVCVPIRGFCASQCQSHHNTQIPTSSTPSPSAPTPTANAHWSLWKSAPSTRNLFITPTQQPTSPTSQPQNEMKDYREYWRIWRTRFQVSVLLVGILAHATITRAGLIPLACFYVRPLNVVDGVDGNVEDYEESRLVANPNISCSGASWSSLLGVSVPILIFLAFGIPAGIALVTIKNHYRLTSRSFRRVWGFVTEAYRPQAYLWECVIMAFKVALVASTVLLTRAGPVAQFSAAMMIEAIFIFAHSWWRPYKLEMLNQLESGAHLVAGMTMAMGLYLAARPLESTTQLDLQTDRSTEQAVSVIVILINVCFIIFGLSLASTRLRDPILQRLSSASSACSSFINRIARCSCCPTSSSPAMRKQNFQSPTITTPPTPYLSHTGLRRGSQFVDTNPISSN